MVVVLSAYLSKATQPPNKIGKMLFDVNVRMVCGMRAFGVEYSALKKQCGYLNMPEPIDSKITTATK